MERREEEAQLLTWLSRVPAAGPGSSSSLPPPFQIHSTFVWLVSFCCFVKKYTFFIMSHKNTLVPSDGYCGVKSNSFCSCSIKRGKGVTPLHVEKQNAVLQELVQKEGGGSRTGTVHSSKVGTAGLQSRSGIQPCCFWAGLCGSRERRQLPTAAWGREGDTERRLQKPLVGFKKEQKHSVLLSSFSKNKTKTSKGRGWLQFETRAFLHKTQRSFTYLSNCNKEHEDQWCQKASNNK